MPEYPFHSEVQQYFPQFDYKSPAGDRNVLCDMRNPNNKVGHQQRAFSCWWALQMCGPMDLGLDVGSGRGLTPHCIHVDLYGDGQSHPFYGGGPYRSDVVRDASDLSIFPSDTFSYLTGNHSLEHIPASQYGGGDSGIVQVLANHWLRVLRPGGIMALVIPDQAHIDVMAVDKDHKHAWSHGDFQQRVLNHVMHLCDMVEFNTFNNNFSFNVVVRKK